MSYSNQKTIIIRKPKCKDRFLQISINDWQDAYMDLSPAAFGLYLYLASNANGYELELSKVAVQNAIGLTKSSYYRAVNELMEKGYLVIDKKENILNFFPKNGTQIPKNETKNSQKQNPNSQKQNQLVPKMSIEIYNTDNIKNTYKKPTEKKEDEFKSSWYGGAQ